MTGKVFSDLLSLILKSKRKIRKALIERDFVNRLGVLVLEILAKDLSGSNLAHVRIRVRVLASWHCLGVCLR